MKAKFFREFVFNRQINMLNILLNNPTFIPSKILGYIYHPVKEYLTTIILFEMIKNKFTLLAKKTTLLVAFLVGFASIKSYSQVDITLGTGTAGNDGTTYPCPLQDYYEGSRMQYLFRASELNAAGMNGGYISTIKFNVTGLNAFGGDIPQFTMKMGHTTSAALSATSWEPVSATVFGPVSYVPTVGLNVLNFTTSFHWDGTSNLVLEICNGDPNNGSVLDYTENVTVPWTTGISYNCSHSYRADNLGNLCGTTTTTNTGSQTSRPNLTFSWTPDVNCSGLPTVGPSTVTPNIACFGQTVNLSNTGGTVASGLLYIWEDSTATSTGWDSIPGAHTKNYSLIQNVTTWYRLKVICTITGDSAYSNVVQAVSNPQMPGGIYTINKGLPTDYPAGINFNTFNAAYNAMKCGISGPVTFNVVPGSGPYVEQLNVVGKVLNSSSTNFILFNGNGNTIQFTATNTNNRAVIKLKGAKYFIFDSLKVDASVGTYSIGFQLTADADSNAISRCTIYSSLTNTKIGSAAGIAITGLDTSAVGIAQTLCDRNLIYGNTIIGGVSGITNVSAFTGGASGYNIIYGNKIRDFYRYGIYDNGSYNTTIRKNIISRPTRASVGAFDGIYYTGRSINDSIIGNRIHTPFGGNPTSALVANGITFDNDTISATNEHKVVNNLIYGFISNGVQAGIYNNASSNIQFFHNTIALLDDLSTSTATTRAYSQNGTVNSIVFLNNIFSINRGGTGTKHCVYFGSVAGNPLASDYNVFEMSSPSGSNYVANNGTNRISLVDWQNATAALQLDINSLEVQPVYYQPFPTTDTSDYHPTNAAVDNKGLALGLDYDIMDVTRPLPPGTSPDMGAYEFNPPPCVPGSLNGSTLIVINGKKIAVTDTTVCENTLVKLNVAVTGPYGSSQTFQWERVTDLTLTPQPFTGANALPDTTFEAHDSYYYRCKISCLGVDYYTNWRKVDVVKAMVVGDYYIESTLGVDSIYTPGTAGGRFRTYNIAVRNMRLCGITGSPGNVVMNIVAATGPYLEQVKIDSVVGATFTRQVVFKGNNTTIGFPVGQPTVNTERAVIKLVRADFINFDSITIDASTAPNFGYGVQLLNNADSNSVTNCNIQANTSSSAANFAGIVVNPTDAGLNNTNANNLCDGNLFSKNTIKGGTFGVVLASAATVPMFANTVSKNTITDFYSTGVFVGGSSSTVVSGNDFSRPTRTLVGLGTGVSFNNTLSLSSIVSGNRFHNFYGGAPTSNNGMYGVSFNSIDATAGNENIVYNNALYDLNGTGVIYGFYNNGSDNVFYYHNSVSLDNPTVVSTSGAAGFYQTAVATGLQFVNNIVHVTRGGTGVKHCINLSTAATAPGLRSNYNILYVDANVVNGHIGNLSGNKTTLAAWQLAQSPQLDSNSFNYDPLFINAAAGDLHPQFYFIDNKATTAIAPAVGIDILDVVRSATPDIGAFEFSPAPCAIPLLGGTANATPNNGLCLEIPIHLDVTGHSPLGSINFQWQDATSPAGPWQNLGPVKFSNTYDTITSVRNYYRCKITCAVTGDSTFSTVTNFVKAPILPGGTYTIDSSQVTTPGPYIPGVTNFQTFADAITAMQCGILGPVVFDVQKGTFNERVRVPYVPGTSSFNTVTFQGNSGIANNKIITWNADATNNYVLRFDSCTYVTFKDLTIENTNATNGRVVDFVVRASNDRLLNCIINTPAATGTATTQSAVYSNATKGVNLTIKGNTITGGSNGVYFTGSSNAAAGLALPGHIIDSNIISGNYGAGIFVQYINKIVVTRNNISYNAPSANNTAGIYANYCDSGSIFKNNKIAINNITQQTYGIQLQNSVNSLTSGYTKVDGNEVYANSGNAANVSGIYITSNDGVDVKNNVIAINSAVVGYGLNNNNNTNNISYAHNSVLVSVPGTNSVPAYMTQSTSVKVDLRNNVFDNVGGGSSVYMNNLANFSSDYNMLYTTGATLVRAGAGAGTSYSGIHQWRNASGRDKWSIVYAPSFVSNQDLHPNLSDPDVWAMHGRGIQVKNDTSDINDKYRPDSLTVGAPDLGAYEFFPTSTPTILPSIPALPVANTEQLFYYGSDTVMRIKWGPNPPTTNVDVTRYSGVVPANLAAQGHSDSMYFYTQVQIAGGGNYTADVKTYYIESWLGSIPQYGSEYQLGLGRLTAGNSWVVGFNSRNDVPKKAVYEYNLVYLDKFTGLLNPYAPPPPPCSENSNEGTEFWVAYPANQLAGGETYVMYLSAKQAAYVKVEIPCLNWVRTYNIPAGVVQVSDIIPQAARKQNSGLYCEGIHITSDVPIVAYAHTYGAASSGASMLMPVCTWGYDYRMLSMHQNWGGGSFAFFYFMAKEDNTKISYSSINATSGVPQSTDVILNKGEWYQVLANSGNDDLTGSVAVSVPNSQGKCLPFAFFSGDTRTLNNKPCGGGGDFVMQQNFPNSAWGKKFVTAPTSQSTNWNSYEKNMFRISIKDNTQNVWVNGTLIYPGGTPPACVESFNIGPNIVGTTTPAYLEFQSICANYITSDRPMMIAQFLSGACTGVGDPEMMYISPMEQGVKDISFYRNNQQAITQNVLTLVGSTANPPTICEGSPCIATTWSGSYVHPNYPGGTKTVYVKHWATSAQRQVSVSSVDTFTAITYGLGNVESYGYNAGTLIRNLGIIGDTLRNRDTLFNATDTISPYTCARTNFKIGTVFPVTPDSIVWKISGIPGITPNQDVVMKKPYNPPPVRYIKPNGDSAVLFTLPGYYSIANGGYYTLVVKWWHPDIEGCDKKREDQQFIQVVPAPGISFTATPNPICPNTLVNFKADTLDQVTSIKVRYWSWKSNPYGINTGQQFIPTTSFFYTTTGQDTVRLHYQMQDNYCTGDTFKLVDINPLPVVSVVKDSVHVCAGQPVNIDVLNPIPGATYTVYDAPTGGNVIGSGDGTTPFVFNNVLNNAIYYVDCITAAGCASVNRKAVKITVTQLPVVTAAPISVTACIGTSATFNVNSPLSNQTYTWYGDATGGTAITSGTSLVINPVINDSTYYVEAMEDGCVSAARFAVNVIAAPTPGVTVVSNAVTTCSGDPASFSISSPQAGVTYNWYDAATGGTLLFNGTTYSISNPTATTQYYISATSSSGCTSSPRLPVTLTVNQRPVPVATPVADSVCKGTTAQFTVVGPISGATYNWYDAATGGTVIGANTISFTTPIVNGPATYYLEGVNLGCISATRFAVKVDTLSVVDTFKVKGDSLYTNEVNFYWRAVPNAVGYEISIDGGAYVPVNNMGVGATGPSHKVSPVTTNKVKATVRAIGKVACQSRISDTAYAYTVHDFSYYPNAFTPNNSGNPFNEHMTICGTSIKEVRYYAVYNQWGQKIWEVSNAPQIGTNCFKLWDGRHNGVLQPAGVYMFTSRIAFLDGRVEEKAGTINLIR